MDSTPEELSRDLARDLPQSAAPSRKLAVVACMDARLDPAQALGLEPGEAHVIRNAGGVLTDDVVRSLCLSQRLLGTTGIVLLHHTRCGVEGLDQEGFLTDLAADAGQRPVWAPGSFADPSDSVRESIRRLRACPFLLHRDDVTGHVYDVDTGALAEVHADS